MSTEMCEWADCEFLIEGLCTYEYSCIVKEGVQSSEGTKI